MSQRERSATRESLIEVARLIVERDGEPALTLGAVADEAGLARATVYGFFSGRNELLEALDPSKPAAMRLVPQPRTEDDEPEIWANCQPDLRSFLPEEAAPDEEPAPSDAWTVPPAAQAAAVAEETPAQIAPAADAAPAAEDEPAAACVEEASAAEAAVDEPAAAAVDEPPSVETAPAADEEPADDAVDAVAPAETVHAAEEPAPEPAAEEPPVLDAGEDERASQDGRRRLQAAHLEEIAKRLILPESALKHGTDAVIARLDTRIRVLEKSITGLETRQSAADTDAPKRLRAVTGMVEQLQARADTADGKQLQTVSELRLSIHQLESRIGALEAPGRGPVAADWPMPPVDAAPIAMAPDADAPEIPPEDAPEDAEAALSDNPRHAYLSTVRSLAKEGARQAEERESAYEVERRSRRRRMVAAACVAAVSLGVVGVLFLLRPGAHGVSMAQSRPGPAPMATHSALAPLDRLSALAQKGDAAAELLVGLKYLQSNDALAAQWLARAAGHSNAVAENALGALYQSGRGVTGDLVKAAALYEASAAQGNRHAMSNLAVLYAGADAQHRNFADAARWFQRSASLGYVDAQFNLAVLYERGDGVPQSLLDAYKWYMVAALSGDAVAKTRADAIATQLSPDELAAAQKAVVEYKPAPLDHAANDVPAMATVLAAR